MKVSYSEITSSREVLAILVERHGHDSVCGVEGFLYAITMMDININIQHPLVVSTNTIQCYSHHISPSGLTEL